jgi:hypothetical protein
MRQVGGELQLVKIEKTANRKVSTMQAFKNRLRKA